MAAWLRWRLLFVFAFICYCDAYSLSFPQLKSAFVLNDITIVGGESILRELLVELRGENFDSDLQIKLTSKENLCEDDIKCKIRETWVHLPNIARFIVIVPNEVENKSIYFCVQQKPPLSVNFGGEVIKWRFAGQDVFIKLSSRTRSNTTVYLNSDFRNTNLKRLKRRQSQQQIASSPSALRITGIRVDHADKEPLLSEEGDGVPVLLADVDAVVRIFGDGITNNTWVTFTQHGGQYGGPCQLTASKEYQVKDSSADERTGVIHITLPIHSDDGAFYMCAKQRTTSEDTADVAVPYVHQGSESWLQLRTYKKLLPLYVSICIIIFCLSFSALFSGLNLGLMSLDRTELKILCNTGNENEKKYARIIQPVRDHGNYLLCSILLGNVLVNSTFTILLDDLTSGLIAIVFSTLAIVMFGEISPQAVCSRHGLAVGARTIYITKAVMILTFPLSYPISRVLDVILGEEIGNVYNRERLKELVKVTTDINDLDKDEVNIISGALELRKKTVSDVMTRIEDVFMLDYEAVLDFETVSEIMKSGFSRIPVYEGNRTNIVTVLYIKDLAFVDPDDNTPLKTLCQFYQNPCNFIFEDTKLDVMFRQFKEGNKGHMAFVTRVNNEGDCDPFYETIGLVTLEDVIEELIQAEIMDETDVFTDNRSKRKRQDRAKRQDFSMFAERRENQRIQISPQLTLATYQYLSTSLDVFKPDAISETTLRRLFKQDVFRLVKKNKKQDKEDMSTYIYNQGKAADYFVLILEGRVEVTVGKENLVFEAGPFTYFGLQALTSNPTATTTAAAASTVAVTSAAGSAAAGLGKSVSFSRRSTLSPPEGERTGGVVGSGVVMVGGSRLQQTSVTVESPTQMGSLQSLNMDALHRFTFSPDYSVRAVTDVLYLRVTRSLYLAAKRATLMERSTTENLDDDDEKLLYSLDADEDSIAPASSPPTANNDPNGVVSFPLPGDNSTEHNQQQRNEEQEPETTSLLKRPASKM